MTRSRSSNRNSRQGSDESEDDESDGKSPVRGRSGNLNSSNGEEVAAQ